MSTDPVDFKSLEFSCVHEKNPPLDAEAEEWYREARMLQRKNEEANAAAIAGLYRKAVDRGHYNAMHRLALMHVEGIGVPRDERAAVSLIERVIDTGVASGYYQMGVFLQQGIGVQVDAAASLSYMRTAADMGNKEAQLAVAKKLRNIEEPDLRERLEPTAIAMLECSFDQGLPEAGYLLGRYHARTTKNVHKALEYFQAAGKMGHSMALFTLFTMFDKGQNGVQQDPARAACYDRLWRDAQAGKTSELLHLDRVCPLPPKLMPQS